MSTYLYKMVLLVIISLLLFSCSSETGSDFTVYDINDKDVNLSDFEDVAIIAWNSR